ncbi:MAG: RNA polymerase-binding transcription factor DksA [Lentimonas sp.]|jgi:RNA polymerase-binding transcription factor DksA
MSKKTSSKKAVAENLVEKVLTNGDQPSAKTASVSRDEGSNEEKSGSIAFSIDDIEALVATRGSTKQAAAPKKSAKKKTAAVEKKVQVEEKPIEKRVLGAASLSDILGFNPAKKESPTSLEETSVPPKWKKYHKLLIELRAHLSDEIILHTSDTLQHHSDDHAGDRKLENDAGTDAFDRDFALSLVSNEQETLNEIEAALLRVKQGTYGVCEVTDKPISKDRLTAVPFTRFSVEGQVEFEKNKRRKVDRGAGGLFADGTDSPKIASDDDD